MQTIPAVNVLKSMERNKWEKAIRCLEIALHPNTGDDEVVAAVNGFRRIAAGTPLSDLYMEFAAQDSGRVPNLDAARWRAKFDQLNKENFDLRLKLAFDESSRAIADRRLWQAERQIDELSDELLTAQHRADEAERQFADLRATYRAMPNGSNQYQTELATRAAPPPRRPVSPFQELLTAAWERTDQANNVVTFRPAAPERGRENDTAARSASTSRAPWTA
jgi:hypothetical protein